MMKLAHTPRGTPLMGMQHGVHLTAASEYVETDEERRAAENSDKEVSAAQSQETPEAAPQEITTMVNYMRATNIDTEGGKDALSRFIRGMGKDIRKDARRCITHFLIRRF